MDSLNALLNSIPSSTYGINYHQSTDVGIGQPNAAMLSTTTAQSSPYQPSLLESRDLSSFVMASDGNQQTRFSHVSTAPEESLKKTTKKRRRKHDFGKNKKRKRSPSTMVEDNERSRNPGRDPMNTNEEMRIDTSTNVGIALPDATSADGQTPSPERGIVDAKPTPSFVDSSLNECTNFHHLAQIVDWFSFQSKSGKREDLRAQIFASMDTTCRLVCSGSARLILNAREYLRLLSYGVRMNTDRNKQEIGTHGASIGFVNHALTDREIINMCDLWYPYADGYTFEFTNISINALCKILENRELIDASACKICYRVLTRLVRIGACPKLIKTNVRPPKSSVKQTADTSRPVASDKVFGEIDDISDDDENNGDEYDDIDFLRK